jgi:hypothetical protein
MSDEHDIDAQLKREGGASMTVRDTRMSALVGIGLAITPIAVVGIGAWIANSIGNLNQTVTRLIVQQEVILKRLDNNDDHDDRQDVRMNYQDERITQTEKDMVAIGGPNYRGGRRGN